MFDARLIFRRDRERQLVQASPEIANCVEHDARGIVRKTFTKDELVDVISGLLISFRDLSARTIWRGIAEKRVQILNMVICSAENALRAGEQVMHG